MGCDIHLNIEYRHPTFGLESLLDETFSVDRNYRLFAALADVCNDDDWPVLFEPRGLPPDLTTRVREQYFLEVIPDGSDDSFKNSPRRWCYESRAREMVDKYFACFAEYENTRYVSVPDWHSASYLTRSEVIAACEYSGFSLSDAPHEFELALEFMESLDRHFGQDSSRLVFWFDN